MTPDWTVHPPGLARFQSRCLWVGLAGLAACLAGAVLAPDRYFQSYLVAYLFWCGLALGSLAILMLQHLSGGDWGVVIRRLLESATRTFPLLVLLFLPLIAGLGSLYEWARPEAVAGDALLQWKAPYLNQPFFLIRSAAYFALWLLLAALLNRWSRQQDETGDPALLRRFQLLSGPGLVLFVFSITFASVDWAMSLEPHWYSTIYGPLVMVGQVLGALCLAIAGVVFLSRAQPLAGIVTPRHLHDLGKLLLAFVMVWAYFGFSQYLIIWAGNLPEEIPWYLRRLQGGWQWVALSLVLFHFVLPFLLLLSRNLKRDSGALIKVALLVLFMRLVDLNWMARPAFTTDGISFHWLDVAAPVGIGGIWLAFFTRQLRRMPLLPLKEPTLVDRLEPAHD